METAERIANDIGSRGIEAEAGETAALSEEATVGSHTAEAAEISEALLPTGGRSLSEASITLNSPASSARIAAAVAARPSSATLPKPLKFATKFKGAANVALLASKFAAAAPANRVSGWTAESAATQLPTPPPTEDIVPAPTFGTFGFVAGTSATTSCRSSIKKAPPPPKASNLPCKSKLW